MRKVSLLPNLLDRQDFFLLSQCLSNISERNKRTAPTFMNDKPKLRVLERGAAYKITLLDNSTIYRCLVASN